MRRTTLHFELPKGQFRTGVSLHSHTRHSLEQAHLLRCYRRHYRAMPAVLRLVERQHRRATGEEFHLDRAYWTPPLEPHQAVAVEAAQILSAGRGAIVSLTDHDSIEAGLSMAASADLRRTPISTEWTVPFGETFFHFGVHNLPQRRASALMQQMAAYTAVPNGPVLGDLLDEMHREPGVLTVLNHPMWDEHGIGPDAHGATLRRLLSRYAGRIHALELNGLRSWAENELASEVAGEFSLPLVSGGDRHGLEPNACINLTQAETFAEFAAEVREDGLSEVAFLPQYRDPLRLRWLETARDIVRVCPEAEPERRHWTGRFLYRCNDGVLRPIAELWGHSRTTPLDAVLSFVRLAGKPMLRPALRLAFSD